MYIQISLTSLLTNSQLQTSTEGQYERKLWLTVKHHDLYYHHYNILPSTIILKEHFPTLPASSVALYVTTVGCFTLNGGIALDGSTVIVGGTSVLSSAIGIIQLAVAVPSFSSTTRMFAGQDFVNIGGVVSFRDEK